MDVPQSRVDTGGPERSNRAKRPTTAPWKSVFRGVRVGSATRLDLTTRAAAALLLHPPGAHLSHATAAELLGVPVPESDEVHVTVHAREDRRYRPGVRPHYRAERSTVTSVHGLPVSAPLQLFIELAGVLSLVDTVVVGDHLVRRRIVTRAELLEHCLSSRGKHTRKARRAARLVRDGVDSPMETRVRLLLVLAGLPEPTINYLVRDESGRVMRRFELVYEDYLLIIEYDGRHHVERIESWESDLDRREEIDDNEWRILVVIGRGVYREPERTIMRVRRALARRGARLSIIDEAWRAHFPQR